ncbi:uncharacterized protein LOC108931497 isoform X1 [Scleropages formosus]|uniref:uncharacterized protein LOC108931497 isoform X1 n=1 Tax=Scleropages formosus TaxID=113540 RepID=UPI000877F113|nr:uncharacterized protein LOC108931497 isoform X1 [Scleropages formosus]
MAILSFLLHTIIVRAVGAVFDDLVIKKNCSELRKGERYHIATAEILGWSPDSCDQEWNLQNHTVVGFIQNTEKSPSVYSPMVSLTKQEAQLESCVNVTITLHCHKVLHITFVVYPDETTEEKTSLSLFIIVALPVVLLLLLLLSAIVFRSCQRKDLTHLRLAPWCCLSPSLQMLERPSCQVPDVCISPPQPAVRWCQREEFYLTQAV